MKQERLWLRMRYGSAYWRSTILSPVALPRMATASCTGHMPSKAIYEELDPETKHGSNQDGPYPQFGETETGRFTAATAFATGKPERNIRRAAARGEALGDDLNDIAGTSLEKGVEMDALAKLPSQERKSVIDRAKSDELTSAFVKCEFGAFIL
jgi:hypothetical protein